MKLFHLLLPVAIVAFLVSCDDRKSSKKPVETCGDGILNADEDCDPDLGEHSCSSLGFAGGTLACGEDCRFDTSGCHDNICAEKLVLDENFELAAEDPDIQIHAAVAFDGEWIWLAYNLPDQPGSSGFDTYLRKMGCDGAPFGDRIPVHPPNTHNEVDPCIAIGPEGLLVAWTRDNGEGPRNMDIWYRLFDLEGNPLHEPRQLVLRVNGQEQDQNAWMPTCAALSDGTFAIGGSYVAEVTFRAFVQRLDSAGETEGNLIAAAGTDDDFDLYPALLATSDGTLVLGFSREPLEGDNALWMIRVDSDNTSATVDPEPVMPGRFGKSVSFAETPHGVVAATGTEEEAELSILVRNLSSMDPVVQLGITGRLEHTPALASGPMGLAVFFYRVRSGIRNDVILQGLSHDGDTFEVKEEVTVTGEGPAGPYGPALTHVYDDVFFAAWAEGISPAFRIRGRFIRL